LTPWRIYSLNTASMARLAIRATGDKSRRDTLTVAHEYAYIKVYDGQRRVADIDVDTVGDIVRINVQAYTARVSIDNVTIKSETHRKD